jgi:tetratricopeptide (TPR) repeat protein
MDEEVEKVEAEVKKEWPALISGVGGITALLGLVATMAGGVTWLVNHHKQSQERQAKMALAQAEADQGEYQAAVASYGEILKDDPTDEPALDAQLKTAEKWVEDFHVSAPEGQDTTVTAGAMLDQIMPVLDAGMARAGGAQAAASRTDNRADILAHIGWAHFLNQKIAEREFGSAAEDDLRAALKQDANDVYANAMLGNWLLETDGDFDEAMHDFNTAVATGQERPMVRTFELGGLRYLDRKGARAAQVRAANDMRKGGEPLGEDAKSRIVSFCFEPGVLERDELMESLTAVSPDEEWKTYLWLDDGPGSGQHQVAHDFIQANLLELSGDRGGALAKYRALQQGLKDEPGSLKEQVDAAVERLKS